MAIEPGQQLLHYRAIEKIGEGGMGAVWKAVDTTLDREVAIKVLPAEFTHDAERLGRFEREAKLLASLNHPNIAAIYGLHEDGSVRFLAMEYVEGEDLAKRLARGPIPQDDALRIACAVADALGSAHANGIIHRDLKPANVVLGAGGKPKVLDFGLAKAFGADPADPTNPSMSPTLTSAGTMAGVILGTAAYMSPEQARGEPVDKRADVWAFGCLLYEMLSGRMLFEERTVTDTLASVLKVEPDWSRLPADVPDNLRHLMRRCLQKDPHRRLHDVADARIELEEILAVPKAQRGAPRAAPTAAPPPRIRRWIPVVTTLIALGLGAAIGLAIRPTESVRPTTRFLIAAADPENSPERPRISPDGRRIVYLQNDRLWLRELDRFETVEIPGTEGARHASWSPDGTQLAFIADDKLWKIPAAGGRATTVSDVEGVNDIAWTEGGTILIQKRRSLHRVADRGGDPILVREAERSRAVDLHGIGRLPGGHGALVIVHGADNHCSLEIWTEEGTTPVLETDEDAFIFNPSYAEPGYVLYTRVLTNGGIWAQPFSLDRLKPTGEPFLVAADGDQASVASDGTLAYVASEPGSRMQVVSFTADGTVEAAIGQPQSEMWLPTPSPDGTKVLITGEESNEYDLWVHDVARGTKTRLTFLDGIEGASGWSPDGGRVYFFHPVFGVESTIYVVPADGRGDPQPLTAGADPTFSADGRQLAFTREHNETGTDLWMATEDEIENARPFLATAADEDMPALSPDAAYLAYRSDESGHEEVYLKSFPDGEGKWQVSIDGGGWPRWSPQGDKLFFVDEGVLYEVNVTTEPTLRLSSPKRLIDGKAKQLLLGRSYGVETSGDRFIAVQELEREEEEGENKAQEQGVRIVQNWLAGFEE